MVCLRQGWREHQNLVYQNILTKANKSFLSPLANEKKKYFKKRLKPKEIKSGLTSAAFLQIKVKKYIYFSNPSPRKNFSPIRVKSHSIAYKAR